MKKGLQSISVLACMLLLMVFTLVGCAAEKQQETENQAVQRVVSLNPDITEIIFALDAQAALVGRTDYCTYPAGTENVESIGDMLSPSIEKIVSLTPDIVLCSSMMMQENIDALTQAGIAVEVLSSVTIADVESNISRIGQLLNKSAEAEQLVADMERSFQAVREKAKEGAKPTVYYVVGFGEYGDYTAGGNTFIGQLITMAGGVNVAEAVTDWSYSLEKLLEDDPDILICSAKYGAEKELVTANGYQELTAIKENRLYAIDEDLVSIAGPRLVEGAELFLSLFQ